MKSAIVVLFLTTFCTNFSTAQPGPVTGKSESQITGVWQINSPNISSAVQTTFRFMPDRSFKYVIDQYEDLNPFRAVTGEYKIRDSTLLLKIKEITIIQDFDVTEASHGFQRGSFVIDGGKTVHRKQADSIFSQHEMLKVLKPKTSDIKYLVIDGEKYYKLSSDPHKYED